ncbi:CHAT domain-containing protein [Flammeovirga sp. SubArs3]|uniref:CHAT domain-containing protein n=1 Tax=Flammeovirga sp. SubArs3 TaxID=2995316 RepID=UPI00248AB169|nr:CHAT domain-containing protein [Flammeovirga sp. SubArs3]
MQTKQLLLLLSFFVTISCAQDKKAVMSFKTSQLRSALPEMQKEYESLEATRSALAKENDDWKANWVEKVVPTLDKEDYYIRSAAAQQLSSFIRLKEQPQLDPFLIDYLSEVEEYLFKVQMDEKESFEEMEELFKMVQSYRWIQTQKYALANPLQKVADNFFYRIPYLDHLEELYKNATPEEKEEYEDLYDDVQRFWKNAKSQSLNFDRIIQEHLAAGTMDYNTTLMLVGKMYSTNQYYLATKLVKDAIEKIEKEGDTTSHYYSSFLLNLSSLYMLQGDYENMLTVQLKQKELGYLQSDAMLISNYQMLGRYKEALDLANNFLDNNDATNPLYPGIKNMKMTVLFEMKDYEKTKKECFDMIEVAEKLGGTVGSGPYFTLANVYKYQGDLKNAQKYALIAYNTSIEEYKRFPEVDANDVASLLYVRMFRFYYYINYVGILVEAKQTDKVDLAKLTEEYETFKYLIKNVMLNPSKMDKKQMVKISEESGDILYSLAEKLPNQATQQLAYDYTLLSKEIGLSSVIAIRKYAADSKNKDLKNLFEHWMDVRKEILFHDPRVDIDSLKDIAFGLHRELATKTRKEVFAVIDEDDVNWEMVKKALKPNEVAVEFVYYAPEKYAALVLKSDMKSPVFIPLCDEQQLKELLPPDNGQQEQWQVNYIYNTNSQKIANLIVDPLRPYLDNVKTVHYSPAGILHGLSMDALQSKNSEKRWGEEYKLKRVSKTSLIASKSQLSPRKATIFGGMNYDENALEQITSESGERGLKLKAKTSGSSTSTNTKSEIQTVGGTFTYLPGTLKEVKLINEELEASKLQVDLFTGNDASEVQFKDFCKAPSDILHIATHAYFSPYIPKDKIAAGSYKGAAMIYSDPDPMNRAGIVFSGANYFWETGERYDDKNDGILMANELSNYDLRATKLAIISACQSGIGQSTRSEGVYGFQRAMKLAGIEHQIISLWTVDDAATQKFMTLFYKYYVELSDIGEAVSKAQATIKEEYENPYYWAAFVHVQ